MMGSVSPQEIFVEPMVLMVPRDRKVSRVFKVLRVMTVLMVPMGSAGLVQVTPLALVS
jgi:hypothetical protein